MSSELGLSHRGRFDSIMRILIVTTEYINLASDNKRGSGIARVVYEASEEMRKRGISVDICSPEGPQISISSTGIPGRLGLALFWQKALKKVRSIEWKYDIVWLHNPILLRRYAGKKTVIATFHSTSMGKMNQPHSCSFKFYILMTSILELISNAKIEKSGFTVTCVSQNVLEELLNIGANKKMVIRNGSQFPLLTNPPVVDCILARSTCFLYVGRLDRIKNPRRIVQYYQMVESLIENPSLVIVGDGPEYNGMLSENDDDSISFMGFVDHDRLLHFYDKADFFIMASTYEGSPLTLMDAINRGLRCIVPDIPSLRFIEELHLGICYDRRDTDRAIEQIRNYVKGNLGKAKNCRVDFTWSSTIDKYTNLFEESMNRE